MNPQPHLHIYYRDRLTKRMRRAKIAAEKTMVAHEELERLEAMRRLSAKTST